MIVDSDVLVDVSTKDDVKMVSIPASKTARELGNPIVANMVLLGSLAKHSKLVSLEMLRDSVKENMKPSMHEINYEALKAGYSLA